MGVSPTRPGSFMKSPEVEVPTIILPLSSLAMTHTVSCPSSAVSFASSHFLLASSVSISRIGIPADAAKRSAPLPHRSQFFFRPQSILAALTGLLTFRTAITAPHLSELPSIHPASRYTSPSLAGRPPSPTEVNAGFRSTSLTAYSTASAADPPERSISYAALTGS